jgi:uncharacterized protein YbjT (DUF2867 family)
VRAIAADPGSGFTARAITRDPSSDAAKALAELPNVEVVSADLEEPASVEAAFAGAYGAFCVTFFWVDFSPETEMRHAQTMANAAKAAGIEHVVWSTLEDTRRFVPLAFYWENLIYFGLGPQRGEDGALAITYPMGDSRLPGIGAADIGKIALGVFKRGPELIGKTIAVSGENLTGAQMAEKLGKALGEEVRYNDVDPDVYRGFGFPAADELGNMFQFKRDFDAEYAGARDRDFALSLDPELQDFDAWLAVHAPQIPLGA